MAFGKFVIVFDSFEKRRLNREMSFCKNLFC